MTQAPREFLMTGLHSEQLSKSKCAKCGKCDEVELLGLLIAKVGKEDTVSIHVKSKCKR